MRKKNSEITDRTERASIITSIPSKLHEFSVHRIYTVVLEMDEIFGNVGRDGTKEKRKIERRG